MHALENISKVHNMNLSQGRIPVKLQTYLCPSEEKNLESKPTASLGLPYLATREYGNNKRPKEAKCNKKALLC